MNPQSSEDVALSAAEEQLIAYLDGKLDGDAAGRVEALIASDPLLSEKSQRLRDAWAMLDVLPRAEVSESFTETTLEMVAVEAEGEIQAVASRHRRGQWLIGATGAGALAVAAVLGFWISRQVVPDANRQLLEDLPLIEDLDLYQQVGSIEYLEQLAESEVFSAEADHDL